MAFEKGHKKLGGREKGTTNSLTKELRKVLKEIVFNEMNNLPDYIESLPNEKRIDIFLKLMPYVFPKVNNIKENHGEPSKFDFLNEN